MIKQMVIFNDVNIEFEIVSRKRKTVKINVLPDGNVQAIIPLDADIGRIKKIIHKKETGFKNRKSISSSSNP